MTTHDASPIMGPRALSTLGARDHLDQFPCSARSAKTRLRSGAVFCQQCGAKLSDPDTAATDTPLAQVDASAVIGRRRPLADVPEETLWEGSYSLKAVLGSLVVCGVVSVAARRRHDVLWGAAAAAMFAVLVGLWLLILGRLAAKRLGIHYRLTNQMFYHRRGLLTRVTNRVEAIDIDDVTFEQGPFDRMVNVGRIKITSSDRTDPVLIVDGVEHVEDVAHLIDKARRAERLRRGVSVESV